MIICEENLSLSLYFEFGTTMLSIAFLCILLNAELDSVYMYDTCFSMN